MECVICVCVWLGAGWEVLGVRGLGLGFTNSGGTWGKWDMCLCFGCGGVGWLGGSCQGLGRWGGVICVDLMYLRCFDFRGELGFLNCDYICMCVVNKQFEFLEFVFESVYVDLQYHEISLNFTARSVCLCDVCSPVVVLGMSVRLSWYPILWVRLLR